MVEINKDQKITLGYILLSVFLATVFLFVFGGAQDSLNTDKFTIYGVIILSTAIYIIIDIFLKLEIFILHQPEMNKILPKKFHNGLTLIFFFLALFLLLAAYNVQNPQSVLNSVFGQTSLPDYYQSVNNSTNTFFDVEPAATAETLGFFAFISLLNIIFIRLTRINPYKFPNFIFFLFGNMLVGGFVWMSYHTAVYGNNDYALLATFQFGVIQAFLWWMFQSVIPAIILHQYNNFYLAINEYFASNDNVILGVYITGIIFLVLFLVNLINENIFKNIIKRVFG